MKITKNSGLTLLEVMVVVAIIGILASLAVPSFNEQMERQRVEGAAEALVAALQNTKAEAITRNVPMRVVFTPSGINASQTNWCYGMTDQADCDCTIADSCIPGSIVNSTSFKGISVNFNTSNTRSFSPLRGTGTSGTVRFSAGNNKTLGVRTLSVGLIRICKDATSTITSYTDSGPC